MRKPIIAIAATTLALAVAAQQPQLCLDPQLLNGLVFLGRADLKPTIGLGQAAFMRDVKVPAPLVLIGSAERDDGMTTAAYRTSLASDKAHAAVTGALATAGWLPESSPSAATFRVEGAAPRDETLCRDGERRLVLVKDVNGVRYVNVVAFPQAGTRACGADPLMEAMPPMSPRNMVPVLRFPEGTSLAQPLGGGSGSNTNFTTTSRIISAQTPASLRDYLAEQIRDLGWQPDASWSSGGGAGSTWNRIRDGEPVLCTLEIIRVSEGTYEVNFTVAMPQ